MTTAEPNLASALAAAGADDVLRYAIFDLLRAAEQRASDSRGFRDQVRAPLITALLGQVGTHTVELSTGLKFEVSPASRIEMALLLSSEDRPNHVWEPQTTKLLTTLARGCKNVVVGGAYIGDHVIPMAQIAEQVHAFEPMRQAHERLLRNIQLNGASNVRPHRIGLWDKSGELLKLDGDMALASSETSPNGDVPSLTIDDYVQREQLASVGLIMLDTEGGEERAIAGAAHVLATHSPNVVFEVHRSFVDWSEGLENTRILRLLTGCGYTCYAVRDYHDNVPMHGRPVEVIPAATVYLEGPPHGFNMLATKDSTLIERCGIKVVKGVSPKLLRGRDPALYAPLN